MSKKLRAGIVSLVILSGVTLTLTLSGVNLVAVEGPSVGVALAGETIEFFDAAFGIVPASDRLQVVADHLIEALAESLGLLAGASHKLIFDGESDVH